MTKKSLETRVAVLETAEYERSKDKRLKDQEQIIMRLQCELMEVKKQICEMSVKLQEKAAKNVTILGRPF